ncbi:hypothetical protein ACVWVR_003276 [Ewingella americana]
MLVIINQKKAFVVGERRQDYSKWMMKHFLIAFLSPITCCKLSN